MKTHLMLLGCIALMVGCEAFKSQGSIIDTAGVGPTPVEPSGEPSNESSDEPSDEPSNEPSSDTNTEDTSDPTALECKEDDGTVDTLPNIMCADGYIWEGETIDATTIGGSNYFTVEHYDTVGWYCEAFFEGDYDSNERAYIFLHPGSNGNAVPCEVTLETRCGDFDLITLRHDTERDGCPEVDRPLSGSNPCDMSATVGLGRTESVELWESQQVPYLIIVDSPNPIDEWFRLSVTCP